MRRDGARVPLWARFAAIVVLAALPGFLVAYLAAHSDRRQEQDHAENESELVLTAAAARYTSALEQTELLLNTLASVPSIVLGGPLCRTELASAVARTAVYDALLVARLDGSVLCASLPDADDVAEESWFPRALRDDSMVVAIEDDLVGALTYRGAQGEAVVVLVARLSFASLESALVPARASEDTRIVLVDAGDIVRYERPVTGAVGTRASAADVVRRIRARADARTGTIVARGTDGVRRIYAYRVLDAPDGAVMYVGIATDVAYASASEDFRERIAALTAGSAVALVAALLVAHLVVTRRLRHLVAVTRRLGRGELSARTAMSPGDEIGVLGRSIDAMAADLEARERERSDLLSAVVQAGELERRRIAADVHDDSIQVMSAHVMTLQLLRRQVDDAALAARIAELEVSGRDATRRLRDLVFELHSPILETLGLRAAIEALLDRAFEGFDAVVEVSSTLTSEPPAAVGAVAYRVAQEAVANVRAHADARAVRVSLRRDGDDLVMRIADDGRGFAPEDVAPRPGHVGLFAARERAAAVGGAVAVDSRPGAGTVVVCRLPWSLAAVEGREPAT